MLNLGIYSADADGKCTCTFLALPSSFSVCSFVFYSTLLLVQEVKVKYNQAWLKFTVLTQLSERG